MSSVCMKYPICSETKGALLLKFHFHTPPPLPPSRPPDTLPSSHPTQPAGDRARARRQAGSCGRSPGTVGLCESGCTLWLQVRGRPWKRRAGSSRAEGSPGPPDDQWRGWRTRWPFLRVSVGPGPWQGPAVWDGNARSAAN